MGCGSKGLGLDKIHHGSNSGYQAINLAYLMGADCIILLGYDMHRRNGNHFFGDHPKKFTNGDYSSFVPRFDALAKDLAREGVEVINCTPGSALHQFRMESLDCALSSLVQAQA